MNKNTNNMKNILNAFSGALAAIPALFLTAFSQLFMGQVALAAKESLYQLFGGMNNSPEENRANELKLAQSLERITPEELRELIELTKKKNYYSGCEMAFVAKVATYEEAKDYLYQSMNSNPNITEEGIEKFLQDNYGEGEEVTA